MLTPDQIEAMVKEKYPVTRLELNCQQEKAIMKDKRDWYRAELTAQQENAPTLN